MPFSFVKQMQEMYFVAQEGTMVGICGLRKSFDRDRYAVGIKGKLEKINCGCH